MVIDGRPIRAEHANADRKFGHCPSLQPLPDLSKGAVLLTRHTGGPITDEEARGVLEFFGDIEETCPISVADQKFANLPEGRWVKFAYFQDCADAQFVRFPSFADCLELTSSQAFKHHEYFRLVTHRAENARPARLRPNNSPFIRNRNPARIHDQPRARPGLVPDALAIYVGDLPLDVTHDQIRSLFGQFGAIVSLDLLHKRVDDSKRQFLASAIHS